MRPRTKVVAVSLSGMGYCPELWCAPEDLLGLSLPFHATDTFHATELGLGTNKRLGFQARAPLLLSHHHLDCVRTSRATLV